MADDSAQVPDRRGGLSNMAQAGKSSAAVGGSSASVILLNLYLVRHGYGTLGVDESISMVSVLTPVLHVGISILAAIGNKLASVLGLAITFHVPANNGNGAVS